MELPTPALKQEEKPAVAKQQEPKTRPKIPPKPIRPDSAKVHQSKGTYKEILTGEGSKDGKRNFGKGNSAAAKKQKITYGKGNKGRGQGALIASVNDAIAESKGAKDATREALSDKRDGKPSTEKPPAEIKPKKTPEEKFKELPDSLVRNSKIVPGFKIENEEPVQIIVSRLYLICIAIGFLLIFAGQYFGIVLPFVNWEPQECISVMEKHYIYEECGIDTYLFSGSYRPILGELLQLLSVREDYNSHEVANRIWYSWKRFMVYPEETLGKFVKPIWVVSDLGFDLELENINGMSPSYYFEMTNTISKAVFNDYLPFHATGWFEAYVSHVIGNRDEGFCFYTDWVYKGNEECWSTPRVEFFYPSVIPLVLVCLLIILSRMVMLSYMDVTNYEVVSFDSYYDCTIPGDERPDVIASADLKHKDPVYAYMKHEFRFIADLVLGDPLAHHLRFRLSNSLLREEKYLVSLELYSQLAIAKYANNTDGPQVVRANIDYAARAFQSVNLSKLVSFAAKEEKMVVNRTSNVAYMAYLEYLIHDRILFQTQPVRVRALSMDIVSVRSSSRSLDESNLIFVSARLVLLIFLGGLLSRLLLWVYSPEQLSRILTRMILRQ